MAFLFGLLLPLPPPPFEKQVFSFLFLFFKALARKIYQLYGQKAQIDFGERVKPHSVDNKLERTQGNKLSRKQMGDTHNALA